MRYASQAQINYIESLAARTGQDKMRLIAFQTGILIDAIEDLSLRQASTVIDLLKEEIANPTEEFGEDAYTYTTAEFEAMFDALDC